MVHLPRPGNGLVLVLVDPFAYVGALELSAPDPEALATDLATAAELAADLAS